MLIFNRATEKSFVFRNTSSIPDSETGKQVVAQTTESCHFSFEIVKK